LHDVDEAHVGAVEVGEKVHDAAWEEDAEVELADKGSLLAVVPIFFCGVVFDAVLAAVWGM
jgi:hypothetical protein